MGMRFCISHQCHKDGVASWKSCTRVNHQTLFQCFFVMRHTPPLYALPQETIHCHFLRCLPIPHRGMVTRHFLVWECNTKDPILSSLKWSRSRMRLQVTYQWTLCVRSHCNQSAEDSTLPSVRNARVYLITQQSPPGLKNRSRVPFVEQFIWFGGVIDSSKDTCFHETGESCSWLYKDTHLENGS